MTTYQNDIDNVTQGEHQASSTDSENITSDKLAVDKPKFPELDTASEDTEFSEFDSKLELLYDLQLPVTIELGRTNMLIRNILKLGRGSVIEFDKLVSEPVDVLVNGRKVAEGEVVVIDKHFGIRITTLVDPSDRLKSIRRKSL